MNTEYLKLMHSERVYGEKNLLESQLGLINIRKIIGNYKKLRAEELNLKITLKKKIQELKDALSVLEKSLPKSKMEKDIENEEETSKKVKMKAKLAKAAKPMKAAKPKGPTTLEMEIDEIKRKLASLQ